MVKNSGVFMDDSGSENEHVTGVLLVDVKVLSFVLAVSVSSASIKSVEYTGYSRLLRLMIPSTATLTVTLVGCTKPAGRINVLPRV